MDDNEFNNSWRDIKQVLQDGANILLDNRGNFNIQCVVDDIKKENVTNAHTLKKIFLSWRESDMDLRETMAEQNAKLDDIRNTVHGIARHIPTDGGQRAMETSGWGMRSDVQLEGGAMSKEKPADDAGVMCHEHRRKLIELYCNSHHTLACVLCCVESHSACTGVISISKLSTGLEQSRELKDVKLSARNQKKLLGTYRREIDEYRVINGGCYDKYIEEFITFKSKIEASLDLLGKRVYIEAEELKERNEKKLDSLSESLKSLEQNLETLMTDINTNETMKRLDHLFIAIKNNTKDIIKNRQKLDEMKRHLHIQTYTFIADPTIQHILDKMVSTSPMKLLSCDVKCTKEIEVKAPKDNNVCCITGLVELSPTAIVAADYDNECLKHIDVDKKIIVTRRTLKSNPHDVAVISGSRVAVTLPYASEIQYYDTQKQLASCGSIHMDGKCYAIKSKEDSLIVSFRDPGKVQMMDFKGRVKESFTTNHRDTQQFDWPWYLSLSPDHTDIYVSDKGNVTCQSTGGLVNWKYNRKHVTADERADREVGGEGEEEKSENVHDQDDADEEQNREDKHANDDEGFFPVGLDTGTDGCLYICSYKTHSIHVVSRAGIRLGIIPVTQCGLRYPQTVCYSKTHDSLYVSSGSEDPDYDNFIRRLSFQ